MKLQRNVALGALLALALNACTSGNAGVEPAIRGVNPVTTSNLQFVVGTANIAGTTGLNVMETLRQSSGASLLYTTPTLTGPASFLVPANAAPTGNVDAGTNRISGSAPVQPGTAAVPSTFGTAGGAFGYGFSPTNSSTSGAATYAKYALPFYSTASARFIGGPPAFGQVRDGTFPAGFTGYSEGFTDFALTPVLGVYSLAVAIPTGFTSAGVATTSTLTTTANLANLTPLPTFTTPTLAPDGNGGGTITVTLPAGVTEAYINIVDTTGGCYPSSQSAPAYYTLRATTLGTQVLTLPANLGPTNPSQTSTPTLCHGDSYQIYAVGFDYPAFASAYPQSSGQQTPQIAGASGQADVTTSTIPVATVYP